MGEIILKYASGSVVWDNHTAVHSLGDVPLEKKPERLVVAKPGLHFVPSGSNLCQVCLNLY